MLVKKTTATATSICSSTVGVCGDKSAGIWKCVVCLNFALTIFRYYKANTRV